MSTISLFRSYPYRPDLAPLANRLLPFGDLAWLTSSGRRGGRFDIVSAAPAQAVRYDAGTLQIGSEYVPTTDPLQALAARWPQPAVDSVHALPFRSGFIGYLGYPLHTTTERQRPPPPDPTGMPMLRGGYYTWALIADHAKRSLVLVGEREPPAEILRAIGSDDDSTGRYALAGPFRSTMQPTSYHRAFARIREHILDGDCYQVNLARHFHAPCSGSPLALLADFKRLQGASYGALLAYPEGSVLSVSPERFVIGRDGHISTWPIKGTAPRGMSAGEDQRLAAALARSIKNRAENVMIVDLLRNDLGRMCETGSVRVEALCHATRHANVHHLQSVVSGRLRQRVGPWLALRTLFPCGSVTGAPKIAAIDIINAEEPVGRSAYCGAIGYVDAATQRFDFNVAIRTAVLSDKTLHVWGGGGLVADSNPNEELAEIDAKVGRLLRGLNHLH